MNPTPEQVAEWTRRSGLASLGGWTEENIQHLVTIARAWQAEQDAKLCEEKSILEGYPTHGYWSASECADAIRDNARK